MRRFLLDEDELIDDIIKIRRTEEIHHIYNVNRLRKGDKLIFIHPDGFFYKSVIEEISNEELTAKVLDKHKESSEPTVLIDLYQAVPKLQKMEQIIQKTVELGISGIKPIITSRCVIKKKDDIDKKLPRWQKICEEAVKQCVRAKIPTIFPALTWKEFLLQLENQNYDLIIFPYENEKNVTIKDLIRGLEPPGPPGRAGSPEPQEPPGPPDRAALIIGPEGGFTDQEAEQIVDIGGKAVGLGNTVLRTETAALAALSMLRYEWEL